MKNETCGNAITPDHVDEISLGENVALPGGERKKAVHRTLGMLNANWLSRDRANRSHHE